MRHCEICASDAVELESSTITKQVNEEAIIVEHFKCGYCFSTFDETNIRTVTKKTKSNFANFQDFHFALMDEFDQMVDMFVASNAFVDTVDRTMIYRLKDIMLNRMEMDHDERIKEFDKFDDLKESN